MPVNSGATCDAPQTAVSQVIKLDGKVTPEVRPKTFNLPELDLLRFGAFLLIFAHHTFPGPDKVPSARLLVRAIKEGSALGVPLFFVLSAFLLASTLSREKVLTGTVHLKKFYVRRALRILPLYVVTLLLAEVIGWNSSSQHIPLNTLLAYLLMVGNHWSAIHGFPPSPLVGPLWSISVEVQFYVFFALILRFLSRKACLWISVALWVFVQVYLFVLGSAAPSADRVWLDTIVQCQYFAIGTLLALTTQGRVPRLKTSVRLMLGGVGLFLLFFWEYKIPFLDFTTPLPPIDLVIGYGLAGVGVALLFLATLGSKPPPAARRFIELGQISYGLYVFHLGSIVLVQSLLRKSNIVHFRLLATWGIALPITIGMAYLSNRYFETRFLRLKRRSEVIPTRPATFA